MRVTQRSPLWARYGVLYALLLLGLVLMHHAPQDGGHHGAHHHDATPVASVHTAAVHTASVHTAAVHAYTGQPAPAAGIAHPTHGAQAAGVAAAQAPLPQGDAGTALHLCLAVVVAVTTLGVALALTGPAPPAAGFRAPRGFVDAPRPRAPVPRMLASLGVLRR